MKHLYGEFSHNQVEETKKYIRSSIYFLLLCADPNTCDEYPDIDVNQTFESLLTKLGGFNKLLYYHKNVVDIMSLLKAAQSVYNEPTFDFRKYRKLILDAGAEVLKIKDGDDNAIIQ